MPSIRPACIILYTFLLSVQSLEKQGMNVAVRSRADIISPSTSLYVVDTLGMYLLTCSVVQLLETVISSSCLPKLVS